MDLRDMAVTAIRRLTGAHTYRVLPRGLDLLHDVRNALPRFRVRVLFDVGANIGQSASRYLPWFPEARLFCFEPASETFRQLRTTLDKETRVRCFQLALGAEPGHGALVLSGTPDMFRLEQLGCGGPAGIQTEPVEVSTVDVFCRDHGIERVNYLKIDTEGADMHVLRGSDAMLAEQRIDLLELEAGMNATNTRHVPWQALAAHLEPRGYLLFGVYEQVTEWPTRRPHLRRANLAFVSQQLIDANGGPP